MKRSRRCVYKAFKFGVHPLLSKPFNTFALLQKLSHGVTGNTSDFGSEESRFEP
jgi:hypothetical protein